MTEDGVPAETADQWLEHVTTGPKKWVDFPLLVATASALETDILVYKWYPSKGWEVAARCPGQEGKMTKPTVLLLHAHLALSSAVMHGSRKQTGLGLQELHVPLGCTRDRPIAERVATETVPRGRVPSPIAERVAKVIACSGPWPKRWRAREPHPGPLHGRGAFAEARREVRGLLGLECTHGEGGGGGGFRGILGRHFQARRLGILPPLECTPGARGSFLSRPEGHESIDAKVASSGVRCIHWTWSSA